MRLVKYYSILSLFVLACLVPAALAQAKQSPWNGQELDTYRHGSTYKVGAAYDGSQCQIACFNDGACKAWSFKPATGIASGMCELKRTVGQSMNVPGARSGIAGYLDQRFTGHRAVWTDTQATAQGSNVPNLGGREVISLAGGANSNQPWPNPGGSNGNGLFHIAQPFAHQLEPNQWVPSINHPGQYEVGGYHAHNAAMATRAPLPKDQIIQLLNDSQPERRGGPIRDAQIYIPPPPQPVIATPTDQVNAMVGQSMPYKANWPVGQPQPYQPTAQVGAIRQDILQSPQAPAYSGYMPQNTQAQPVYTQQQQAYYTQQAAPVYANTARVMQRAAPVNPASPAIVPSAHAPQYTTQQVQVQPAPMMNTGGRRLPEVNSLNLMPVPQAQIPTQTNPSEYYPQRQAAEMGRTDFYPGGATSQTQNTAVLPNQGSSNFYPNTSGGAAQPY